MSKRRRRGGREQDKEQPAPKSPNSKRAGRGNKENPVEPNGVAKLDTGKGKGGQECDGSIKYDFHRCPIHFNRDISDDQSADDRKRAGKTAGAVSCLILK